MLDDKKQAFKYPFSRRRFIKGIAATSLLSMAPWLTACQFDSKVKNESSDEQNPLTFAIFNILFPRDEFGPSSVDIQAESYLNWLLADPNYDADIQANIKDGLVHFAEFVKAQTGKNFEQLAQKEQKEIIAKATEQTWGENFFSRLVSVGIDAFVIDPIYGTNQNEAGWKWLNHIPGQPRPNPKNKYPNILHRKKEHKIISQLTDL